MRLPLLAALAALAAALPDGPAAAQSFDCAKATTADEKAVCGNGRLAALDDEMAALYRDIEARTLMGMRGAVRDDQRTFLDRRRACGGDVACIRDLYRARIAELEKTRAQIGTREGG